MMMMIKQQKARKQEPIQRVRVVLRYVLCDGGASMQHHHHRCVVRIINLQSIYKCIHGSVAPINPVWNVHFFCFFFWDGERRE